MKNQCHQVSVCDNQRHGMPRVKDIIQCVPSAIQNLACRLASGCVKVVVVD